MEEQSMVRALVSERTKVLAYIQSLVRDADVAEDIFQDVCVLAVEKRSSIADVPHLLNWLRTTARFTALNVIRKRGEQRRTLGSQTLDMLEPEWTAADAEDAAARNEALRRCLGRLSPQVQSLVRQRYVQQVDYATLAETTRRSVKSLYVTFSRVYAALGDCIAKELGHAGRSHG